MRVRDIPGIGRLIDSAVLYLTTLAKIARHPFRFADGIAFDDPEARRRAFRFLGTAIALAYLIVLPALARHGFDVGRLRFSVVVLLRLGLVTVLYHAAFLVAGYRQPLTKSLILSSYVNGVYFPLFMAAMLPGFLAAGPHGFFDPLGGTLAPGELAAGDELPVAAALALLLFVAYPFFFAVASVWWARAFGARTAVSAALLLAAVLLAGLGNFYVLPWITRLLV
jgi:hypothetical protein